MTSSPAADPAAILEEIRERSRWTSSADQISAPGATAKRSAEDVPRLLAALEAVLKLAGGWTRQSEVLDAVAENPDALTGLKHGRSVALDECAGVLRETITRALTEQEGCE